MNKGRRTVLAMGLALAVSAAFLFSGLQNIQRAAGASIYVSERIDGGTDEKLQFYYDSAWLVSEYWEDSYRTETSYTKKAGAKRVNGKWYLPADDFDGYEASYTYKGKKYVPLETLDESGVFEIDSTKKTVTVDRPYQMKRLIVKMKKGSLTPRHYGALKCAHDGNGLYVLQFSSEERTKKAYDMLAAKTTKVEYVEADRFISMIEPEDITNPVIYDGDTVPGKTKKNALQEADPVRGMTGWEQDMLGVERLAQRLGAAGLDRSVTVAIVDTGIDYTHPYLSDYVPDRGYDFINNDYDAYDDNSHGTHVAGIVVNTMSDTAVKLLPVKVLSGDGYGSSLSVSNGILYAAECGADVINLSLGGASTGSGHYEDRAIADAVSMGAVVVVAAGNDSSDTAYSCPAHNSSAIVVAAIDEDMDRAYFSNYGNSVDVSAPGVDIYSSIPGGGYAFYSGTSMAAPHISGVAALLKKAYPEYKCSEIESLITANCIDLGTAGFDVYYGYGVPEVSKISLPDEGYPTAVPSASPVVPTAVPTVVPTVSPVVPTGVPVVSPEPSRIPFPTYPPFWDWNDWPWPSLIPVQPTQAPVSPTPFPTPIPGYPTIGPTKAPLPTQAPVYGDISTSISTVASYAGGVRSVTIKISTGSGIRNVVISGSDGTRYEYVNEGNGISRSLTISGGGGTTVFSIYSYDYYGNAVQSSMLTV